MKMLIYLFIFLLAGNSLSSGCEDKPQGVDPADQEPVKPAYIEPDATGMRPELNAIDFSKLMGIGWNLGNSLEAITFNNGVYSGDETSWGNPATTKQLIDSVKKAGISATMTITSSLPERMRSMWKATIMHPLQKILLFRTHSTRLL